MRLRRCFTRSEALIYNRATSFPAASNQHLERDGERRDALRHDLWNGRMLCKWNQFVGGRRRFVDRIADHHPIVSLRIWPRASRFLLTRGFFLANEFYAMETRTGNSNVEEK